MSADAFECSRLLTGTRQSLTVGALPLVRALFLHAPQGSGPAVVHPLGCQVLRAAPTILPSRPPAACSTSLVVKCARWSTTGSPTSMPRRPRCPAEYGDVVVADDAVPDDALPDPV